MGIPIEEVKYEDIETAYAGRCDTAVVQRHLENARMSLKLRVRRESLQRQVQESRERAGRDSTEVHEQSEGDQSGIKDMEAILWRFFGCSPSSRGS